MLFRSGLAPVVFTPRALERRVPCRSFYLDVQLLEDYWVRRKYHHTMSSTLVYAIDEALAIAGPNRIACNQVLYHVGERAIEHAVLPWCEKHAVALVGYSPFGHSDFPGANTPGGFVLADVAKAHGATPRQAALAFLTRRPDRKSTRLNSSH